MGFIYRICLTSIVALCGWAAKADDSFVCFGAKPDKGFLDMKSRRIRKWEGDANKSWRLDGRATGQQRVGVGTAKRVGVEPRTGAVNTGLRRPVADKMGSSEEDESR